MKIVSIFEIVIMFFYIAYLVYNYSRKDINKGIKITVFFSWILSFGFIILLPLDIYYVRINSNEKIKKKINE